MKNVKYLILALFISPLLIGSIGCSDDPPPPPPDPTTEDTAAFGWKFDFQTYAMVLDDNLSAAYYNANLDQTVITLVGYSEKGTDGGTITSKGELELTFAGKEAKLYTQASTDFSLELAVGEGVRRKVYASDAGTQVQVTITKYDEVGGYIEGNFNATLKDGINSKVFSNGHFSIKREEDR